MKKKKGDTKIVLRNFLIALVAIAFWRGAWGLMDIYIFPKSLILSYTFSVVVGIIILYLIKPRLKDLE